MLDPHDYLNGKIAVSTSGSYETSVIDGVYNYSTDDPRVFLRADADGEITSCDLGDLYGDNWLFANRDEAARFIAEQKAENGESGEPGDAAEAFAA